MPRLRRAQLRSAALATFGLLVVARLTPWWVVGLAAVAGWALALQSAASNCPAAEDSVTCKPFQMLPQ